MKPLFRGAMVFIGLLAVSACSINVKKNDSGEDKNVDIKTPFGEIHVDKGADVRDTGLPVYAGARIAPDKGKDEKSANVNISSFGFGLKVVAVKYESDDEPSKVVAFYKEQLKRYGSVLECHKTGQNYSYNHNSDELKCEGDNSGQTVELKVGNKNNQHIVEIEPSGRGSNFSLVYVRVRGKEDTI